MSPKDQRQSEWEIRVSDYKASGMKMADWCSANRVTLEQLKYWIRKFKRLSSSVTPSAAIRFVPLTTSEITSVPASSLVVRVGLASIELQSGFNPQLLREAVEALSASC